MIPVIILIAICVGVWYLVKQTAIAFQKPEWWDHADIAAGAVGFVGFAYVYHPYVYRAHVYNPYVYQYDDPLLMLLYRSLVFGVGVMIMTLMLGLGAEDASLLRTPDKLAPIEARLFGKASSVDELDDGTLAEYTEET